MDILTEKVMTIELCTFDVGALVAVAEISCDKPASVYEGMGGNFCFSNARSCSKAS